ncbi:hypothetical protein F5Y09DRAFT_343398 [Xylaria sp. FL1042]|nr:hypothetical protein F5Y09DRAFT_343398 [Xylaria sp. FL1042]
MDPLSVIASIAGVSTAGISLSRAIYDIISTIRNAPKEVSDIARGLCDLSFILRELRRVLKDGQDIYRKRLIRHVASAIKRVGRVQSEIEELLDIRGGGTKLRWAFRKSKVTELLYTIESHKTGINMILQTMMLAVQVKQLSKENGRENSANNIEEKQSVLNDTEIALQQAENVVEISYHSIRELTSGTLNSAWRPLSDYEENDDSNHTENSQSQQIQIRNAGAFDTATWLYELVFITAVKATAESSNSKPEQSLTPDNSVTSGLPKDAGNVAASSSYSQSLIPYHSSSLRQIQSLEQHPPAASKVVNELLSEWTTLTKGEIMEINRLQEREIEPNHKAGFDVVDDAESMLRFEDAIGRRYKIPFDRIRKWKDMEALINQMFTNVDVFGLRVQAGNYDLLDSRGNIVPRSSWKYTIEPTETYRMVMWPFNNTSKARQNNQSKGGKERARPARKRGTPVLPPLLLKLLEL